MFKMQWISIKNHPASNFLTCCRYSKHCEAILCVCFNATNKDIFKSCSISTGVHCSPSRDPALTFPHLFFARHPRFFSPPPPCTQGSYCSITASAAWGSGLLSLHFQVHFTPFPVLQSFSHFLPAQISLSLEGRSSHFRIYECTGCLFRKIKQKDQIILNYYPAFSTSCH